MRRVKVTMRSNRHYVWRLHTTIAHRATYDPRFVRCCRIFGQRSTHWITTAFIRPNIDVVRIVVVVFVILATNAIRLVDVEVALVRDHNILRRSENCGARKNEERSHHDLYRTTM